MIFCTCKTGAGAAAPAVTLSSELSSGSGFPGPSCPGRLPPALAHVPGPPIPPPGSVSYASWLPKPASHGFAVSRPLGATSLPSWQPSAGLWESIRDDNAFSNASGITLTSSQSSRGTGTVYGIRTALPDITTWLEATFPPMWWTEHLPQNPARYTKCWGQIPQPGT